MPLTFPKLVIASNNAGKIRELQHLFQTLDSQTNWQVLSQSDFNTPDIEENGLSFIENAILKARNAAKFSQLPALADDSGLVVPFLDGEPGIYSARYAGEHGNDLRNNEKLLHCLSDAAKSQRKANFRCCIALVRHERDPCPVIAEGIWHGEIAYDLKGDNGFGYDPLFIIQGSALRAAELSAEQKSQISHRALAFQQLYNQLQQLDG